MKKHKKKNTAKNFLLILVSVVIGYILYYNVFMEIIPLFFSSDITYLVVSIMCLIGSIAGCIIVLDLLVNKKISKNLFILICIVYFVVMLTALFLRQSLERVFVFNPLIGLVDTFTNSQMFMQSIMNLVLFVPVGYFLRKKKRFNQILIASTISIGIEILQVALMRGFFDTFDIILYFIGINMGCFIFKKIELKIE